MERQQIDRLFKDSLDEKTVGSAHFILFVDTAIKEMEKQIGSGNPTAVFPTVRDGNRDSGWGEMIPMPFENCLIEFRGHDFLSFIHMRRADKTPLLGKLDWHPIYVSWIEQEQDRFLCLQGLIYSSTKYCVRMGATKIRFDWKKMVRESLPIDGEEPIIPLACVFISLSTHPANSVVQRFPKEKKNDVNWVASRSHYLIIDNDESKTISHSGISRSLDGMITRAMHARRAHFRTLRHEKFKANIGKRIWVHSCWVGPKEWEGTDAKIYRVVASRKTELVQPPIMTESIA